MLASSILLSIALVLTDGVGAPDAIWPSVPADSGAAWDARVGLTSADTVPLLRTRGTFIGLSVADLEPSTKWYVEKLGLKIVMQVPWTAESQSSMVLLQGGGLTVELVQRDGAVPRAEVLPGGRGALFIHGIFKVGVVIDDFDATVAALRARGVDIAFGPFPARDGRPANIMIRDNAGNYIQLFGREER